MRSSLSLLYLGIMIEGIRNPISPLLAARARPSFEAVLSSLVGSYPGYWRGRVHFRPAYACVCLHPEHVDEHVDTHAPPHAAHGT